MYEEILDIYGEKIESFFRNAPTFKNQLKYEAVNDKCFKAMYKNNSASSPKKVKELKEKIPELTCMCKNCGAYYMNPRNKSRMKLDLVMGQFFEDILIDYFNNYLKIPVEHGDKSNKQYPDCMILGKDRGIIAYFEVKYHCAPFIMAYQKIGRYCYEGSATLDAKKITRQLEIIESDIERPVFYIHWIDYPCLKGIFFETSEQVKETIRNEQVFERRAREGDLDKSPRSIYREKVYSPLLEMGTMEEFVEIIKRMRNGTSK